MTTIAYAELINRALERGYVVSVFDGEEWAVRQSRGRTTILQAIQSVEESEVIIRDAQGQKQAWALIIPYGVEPEETVADFSGEAWVWKLMDRI